MGRKIFWCGSCRNVIRFEDTDGKDETAFEKCKACKKKENRDSEIKEKINEEPQE